MKLNLCIRFAILVLMALSIGGCVTHRIDWNGRIGSYTLDQAVTELGPPDKQAKLTDGRIVAEWVSRYYGGGTTVIGAGYYGYPGTIIATPPTYYESQLLLTFKTNNVLSAWSKR